MIGEAAAFADKAHKGAFRKGTKINPAAPSFYIFRMTTGNWVLT